MKNRLVIAVFMIFVAFMTFAQDITLVNQTQGHVFVSARPVGPRQYEEFLANPSRFRGLVLESFESMTPLAPGAFIQGFPVFQNDTLIYGISVIPGQEGAVLFQFRVSQGMGSHSFAILPSTFIQDPFSNQPIRLSAFEIPTFSSPILIDRRFVDWLNIPDLRRFARTFRPEQITQRFNGQRLELSLADSQFWQKGGTQIDRIKAGVFENDFFGMVSSFQTLTRGTRFLFRYFVDLDQRNLFTLEIPVVGIGGPVHLWVPGESLPTVIGQYGVANFNLEFQVTIDRLVELFELNPFRQGYWEVSSAQAEAGLTEEFLYTIIRSEEIMSFGR
jgi:hypothetical protein